jgi:hypothetical protein
MPNSAGWLSLLGFLGLAVAADAQTPLSQPAGPQFDGTYAFVSSTKLTEMFTVASTGRMRPCPDREAGPLTNRKGSAEVLLRFVFFRSRGVRRNGWVSG